MKGDEYVFEKLSELLSNEKMIKAIVANINKQRKTKVAPAKKEIQRIDKELQKLDKKKGKIFEAYEDEIISKEEFFNRKEELNEKIQRLLEKREPYIIAISEDTEQQVPYELIKSVLENFSMLLEKSGSREEKKLLLHMIILEITINKLREIDSIKLKINDNLIEYISK